MPADSGSSSGRVAVGIDIGGTKISVGLVDSSGHLISHRTGPTDSASGPSSVEKRLCRMIDGLCDGADLPVEKLVGIGVGGPGPLDPANGVFQNPYTLPGLERWAVTDFLQTHYRVPAILENDADMAALGEAARCGSGAGGTDGPLLMLTIGTGIGGAVILNGAILRGSHGEHPEFGLIPVLEDGPSCYSGVRGSLESWTSGSALSRFANESGLSGPAELFSSKSEEVLRFMDRVALAWKRGIQCYLHTFHPGTIILGGGVMDHQYEWYRLRTVEAIEESALISPQKVSIHKALLGNTAGMCGAALRVLHSIH